MQRNKIFLSHSKSSVSVIYYISNSFPVAIQMSVVNLAVSFCFSNELLPDHSQIGWNVFLALGYGAGCGENRIEELDSVQSTRSR